jgi:hypothetical protein
MSTSIAQEFLTRCFLLGDTVALFLRKENPASTTQRIVRLEQVLSPRYLTWLLYENHHGANIYISANPLRPGSRKRTKDSIADVRHLYLDIDEDGEERIAALRASNTAPVPNAILSTSPGKCQVLWRVEGFDFVQQESTLKMLAMAFGGDPACTDRNRVLRLPGFQNHKYDPAHPVTVEYLSTSTYQPEGFRLDDAEPESGISHGGFSRTCAAGKNTPSEQDWAWVLQQLSLGMDAAKLTHILASRRSDKSNPLYYAQRTIDIASARLLLLEGVAIEDVIATLERRRTSELPAAICSSRSREIATTAQQIIARTRFASVHHSKENHNAPA